MPSPWEWGRNGNGNTQGLVVIHHTFYGAEVKANRLRSTLIRYLPYLVLRAIKNIPTWKRVINFEIKLNANLFCTKDYNDFKNINLT